MRFNAIIPFSLVQDYLYFQNDKFSTRLRRRRFYPEHILRACPERMEGFSISSVEGLVPITEQALYLFRIDIRYNKLKPIMKRKESPTIIGRKDKVDFPGLGLYDIDAKVDTGAHTSCIHCCNIMIINETRGEKVSFALLDPLHPYYNNKKLTLPIYAKRKIKNSFGQVEERYIIKTQILLFGQVLDIELSLTDRSKMEYPVLLGRKLLFNRFVVDVRQIDLSYKQKCIRPATKAQRRSTREVRSRKPRIQNTE